MFGCQSNNLVEELKNNYAPETKAVVFNKNEVLNKIKIPLNGMIMVKENETIFTIANKNFNSSINSKIIIVDNLANSYLRIFRVLKELTNGEILFFNIDIRDRQETRTGRT